MPAAYAPGQKDVKFRRGSQVLADFLRFTLFPENGKTDDPLPETSTKCAPSDLKISFREKISGNTANTAASSHLYTSRTRREESGGEEACPQKNLKNEDIRLKISVTQDPKIE